MGARLGIGWISAAMLTALCVWPQTSRADQPIVATCPISLPSAASGAKPAAFLSLKLRVGSPDGTLGTIAQARSEFDASGKHGRDFFPTSGEVDVFLVCRYEGDRYTTQKLPPGPRLCEVHYTYIGDYDTRPERIFCR